MANVKDLLVNGSARVIGTIYGNATSANNSDKLDGKHLSEIAAAKSTTLAWDASSIIATIGGNNITITMPANPNTDTHYTTGITAGATGTTSNSATTNGNTFIKIKDNSTHRGQIKLVGSGATSVSSDANGIITISSTDNNTTYGSMSISEGTTGTATSNRVLTAANLKEIINAHAPTKTGGGASGTWGISISGNAAGLNYYPIDTNLTVAQAKDQIRSKLYGKGIAAAVLSSSYINQWNTDTASFYSSSTHSIIALNPGYNNNAYGHFLVAHFGDNDLCHIGVDKNKWCRLRTLLDSVNYTNYTVTKTGSGASGTWGISISGNAESASKVNNKLTVGSKTYDGSAAVTISASDLGLSSAMLFLGTTTTAITDGATTNPVAIGGSNKTVIAGNVVLYGSKEFVWTGSAWEELGNEGSYKIVQAAVGDPGASGTSNTFIATISQDANGKITATKKTVAVTNSAPTLAWGTTSTIGTVAGTNLQVTMPTNPNVDTKVTQNAITSSDYTNWRPLIWGASNSSTEGFTPSTVTDGVYTAQTLSCQPSSGTIRANTFKGNLTGNAATATNADKLDGYHENSFLRYRDTVSGSGGTSHSDSLWSQIGIRQYNNALPDAMADNATYTYGSVISLPGNDSRLDIWYNHQTSDSNDGLRYRTGWNDDKRAWATILDSLNYGTIADGRYVKKTGDIMTGKLQVNAPIFGYNYINSSNAAAFTFDKPGSYYTGIGGNGATDTIYFCACDSNAEWITSYKQKWVFNGSVTADTFYGTLDGNAATSTTTSKLSSAGHLDTAEKLDAFIEDGKLKYATVASVGGVASDGMIISVPWNNSWGHQVFLDDSAMVMQHRHRYTKTNSDGSTAQVWSGWATLLDSSNYTNYSIKKSGDTMSGALTTPNLFVINDNSNSVYDSLAYFRHYSNNDWCVTVDCGSYEWGLNVITNANSSHGIVCNSRITGNKVYGAVWNDYAEYRKSDITEPGRIVIENGDGTLSLSTKRLQRGAEVISDTYGFAIGETNECKTPIAATGRVLAYTYEPVEEYRSKTGWPVCSGPNGTISIMTEEEEEKYPSRIIGTISEVPDYEEWGTGKVKTNGRVWIRIK